MPGVPVLTTAIAVTFSHSVAETVSASHGLDLLHIKGPALSPALTGHDASGERTSMDADVWIRPSQADSFIEAMASHRWTIYSTFSEGSSFEHAATMMHPKLASLDVHRQFPGITIDPEAAFDQLWAQRDTLLIAGVPCTVPSLAAQRLILLLNAARGSAKPEVAIAWESAAPAEQHCVRALARRLGAEVALGAAIGELEQFKNHRDYELWRLLSTHTGTPTELWRARIKAEPTRWAAVRRAFRLALPTRHRMSLAAGRELKGAALVGAYLRRIRPVFRAVRARVSRFFNRTRADRT